MTSAPSPAGIVFRVCRSESERHALVGLLVDNTTPVPPGASGDEMFALWDLTGPPDEGPVGAVAIRTLEGGATVAVCGIAVAMGRRRQGYGRRLVCEVVNLLRRRGAARLVDDLRADEGAGVALLRQCGFTPADVRDGRLELEL